MGEKLMTFDVISIGNPLLDITVDVDFDFLESHKLSKGGSHLIDIFQSNKIQQDFSEKQKNISPGGSSAAHD